jgi:hypothetical protein
MDEMFWVTFAILGFVSFVVFLIWASKVDARDEQIWRELAARTGLTYERGVGQLRPRLVGMYRNRTLTSDVIEMGGNSPFPVEYSRVVLPINNQANIYMKLSTKGKSIKTDKFLETPQKEFDRQWVTSRPADFAINLFDSTDLRQRLLQAPYWFEIKVDRHKIHFEGGFVAMGMTFIDPSTLQSVFDLLSDLADAIEKASSGISS